MVHAHPPLATGFAVAGIPLDRAVLAEVITTLGSIPIAEYATPSTQELPAAVRQYIKAHDGLLLANHGALTVGARSSAPTTRWKPSSTSRTSAWWRGCSAASACCRRTRSCACRALRGKYGIAAPAPICVDDEAPPAGDAACQVVRAPDAPGARLVPDLAERASARTRGARRRDDEEIRLTYRELTALIEDAVAICGSAGRQTRWVKRWAWSKPRASSP